MNVKDFENKFSDILAVEIKGLPEKVSTLFDIAGFPHYETVISNFYAYYFNPTENHGLGDLFISALSNLICIKTTSDKVIRNVAFCSVEREVHTENGKYIDIVILESSQPGNKPENAIIIENKVYASLYNDLLEYYQQIKVTGRKIGVVFSLRKERVLPDNYINITHKEFMSAIEQSSGLYFLNIEPKHFIIFKEFVQNIKHMTHSSDLSAQYDFYFKYQEKINEIAILNGIITEDIFKQATDACEKLDLGLEIRSGSNKSLRYYISKRSSVYFTIWLAELVSSEHSLSIMVELDGRGIKHLENINEIEFTPEEKILLKETAPVRKAFLQYAVKTSFPTPTQIQNLTDHIYDEIIKTPLKSIFIKIDNLLAELET